MSRSAPVSRAVHAAPRADDARHPRDLLRAPGEHRVCRRRGCSTTTATSTRNEPFVHVVDEPPHTKATTGSNSVHVTVRFDDRTGTVVAIAAEDNLVKGASGQAIQNANLLLGLPETLGLPRSRDVSVSVTAAQGFVAGGGAVGIKDGNASRPRDRRDRRITSRCRPRPCSRPTSRARRRCR